MAKTNKKDLNKNGFVASVVQVLEGALALSQAFERLLVDVVASFVPWLAPVIPAYLAFDSLYGVLIKGVLWISVVGAAVVEFLGLATVTTVVQFNDFNETRKEGDPKAPLWPAVLTAGFYLIVILTVNVLLDTAEPIHKFAKLLMSSLSVAGAITISLRGQHRRRVEAKAIRDAKAEEERQAREASEREEKHRAAEERRKNKQELKVLELKVKLAEKEESLPKVSTKVSEPDRDKPATFGKWEHWRKVPADEKLKIARMTMEQVRDTYGVIERTAYNWLEYAKRESGVVGEVAQFQEQMVSALTE